MILSAINLLYASIINQIVKQWFKLVVPMELSDIKYGAVAAKVKADFVFETETDLFPYYSVKQDLL